MKRIIAALLSASLGAAGALGMASAQAQSQVGEAPARATMVSQTAIDPAMHRLFMTMAMSVLSNFATSAARGSLDGFDPGPAIESALKGALSSRDINAVIDRLVEQAGNGSEAAGASPEVRAMLKAALTGVVAMARSEIAREWSGNPGTSGNPGAFGTPAPGSSMIP